LTEKGADGRAVATASHTLVARLYRGHVRRHLGKLIVAALCMAAVAGATAANAWLMQPVLDDVFLKRNETMLVLVPAAVLVVALIKGIAGYFQGYLMAAVGQRIISDVQVDLYGHLMRADLSYFRDLASGRLVSNFLNDANLLRDAVSKALTGMAKDLLMVLFLVGLMFYQDWRLATVQSCQCASSGSACARPRPPARTLPARSPRC
jgi:subfamily B ATP-binding cassette protein MsbA